MLPDANLRHQETLDCAKRRKGGRPIPLLSARAVTGTVTVIRPSPAGGGSDSTVLDLGLPVSPIPADVIIMIIWRVTVTQIWYDLFLIFPVCQVLRFFSSFALATVNFLGI